jgi:hypothetical protein
MALRIDSILGFGAVCAAELTGEIGTIARFAKESSFALYLGMASLDNSSGTNNASKPLKHVNARAKAAMMVGVDRHRKQVSELQRYYERKRPQGKSHNQAICALRRHLCRTMYSTIRQDRPYELRNSDLQVERTALENYSVMFTPCLLPVASMTTNSARPASRQTPPLRLSV